MESFNNNSVDYLNEDATESEQSNIGISVDDTTPVQIMDEVINLYLQPQTTPLPSINTVPHDVDDFMFSAECANTVRYDAQTSLHTVRGHITITLNLQKTNSQAAE